MVNVIVIEVLIHLLTLFIIILPLIFYMTVLKNESREKKDSLLILLVGLIPISIYHLFEVLFVFNIPMLPPEGTLLHTAIEHAVIIFMVLMVGWFFYRSREKQVSG